VEVEQCLNYGMGIIIELQGSLKQAGLYCSNAVEAAIGVLRVMLLSDGRAEFGRRFVAQGAVSW